jgi:hypothetical protein
MNHLVNEGQGRQKRFLPSSDVITVVVVVVALPSILFSHLLLHPPSCFIFL